MGGGHEHRHGHAGAAEGGGAAEQGEGEGEDEEGGQVLDARLLLRCWDARVSECRAHVTVANAVLAAGGVRPPLPPKLTSFDACWTP